MEFLEYPLLHYADLMLTLLRVGEAADASLSKAAARLAAELDQAHERPPVSGEEMMERLATARLHLVNAGLLEERADGRFNITERGRRALAQHPGGIDDTVLMQFEEFRQWLHRRTAHADPEDCCGDSFRDGYASQQAGRSHLANPHRQDTAAHLAWESGWFAARDEASCHHE